MNLFTALVHYIDTHVHTGFLFLREDEVIVLFKGITWLGNWQIVLSGIIGFGIFLFYKKISQYIIPLLLGILSSALTTFFLKVLIARPRPFDGLLTENDFSFPSGHATMAVAFYGFLTFVVYGEFAQTKLQRQMCLFWGVLIILLIGFSRLYLGVHYMSDVIAGDIVGSMGLFLGIILSKPLLKNRKINN